MAFFRTVSFSEPLPIIEGDGVYLRAPQMSDYSEWATLREASRAFLTPWEPTWPADDLTRSAFRRRLRRYAEDQRADTSYAFFLFRKSDDALVGGLTLANIRRGVAQAGSLGYWIGEPFARRGLMTGARARRWCRSPSARCGCTGSKRPAFRPTPPRSGFWKRRASCARAMRANISASTGCGRITCCSRGSMATARFDRALGRPRSAWLEHGWGALWVWG